MSGLGGRHGGIPGGELVTVTDPAPNSGPATSTSAQRAFQQAGLARGFWGAGHRAACWILIVLTFVALTLAATIWSLLVTGRWLGLSAASVTIVFLILMARGHFRVRMVPDTTSRIPLIAVAVAAGGGVAMMISSTRWLVQPPMQIFVWLLVAIFFAAVVSQAIGAQLLKWQWTKGNLRSRALVYGCDELAIEVAVEIGLRDEYGVDIVGFVAPKEDLQRQPLPVRGFDLSAGIDSVVDVTAADRMIVGPATPDGDRAAIDAARIASGRGVAVFVVPRFFQMGLGMDSMSPDRIRGYPLVRLQRSVHPHVAIKLKRLFDIVIASIVLVATAPICLVAALAVKLTSRGPIHFAQVRIGQHGKAITIYKFRSMTESQSSDTEWTADARVTRVGKLLRRTNVDELPQLWSVLKGDMSLVGPRPERPAFVERFGSTIPDYEYRHRMPVGLTGLAQIVGLRGDTSIAERVKYDNLYIDQWSLEADLQILAKTAHAVLRQKSYARNVLELEEALGASTAAREPRPLNQPSGG